MEKLQSNINSIPVKTWNWLGVNAATLEADIPAVTDYLKQPVQQGCTKGVTITDIRSKRNQIQFMEKKMDVGASDAMKDFVKANQNSGYCIEIEKEQKIETPIILQYDLDEQNPTLVDDHFILAHENSEATIIINYTSSCRKAGFHSGVTKVFAQQGAIVHLIKVQMLADQDTHIDAVGAIADENGQVDLTLLEIGALQTVTGCKVQLIGKNSIGTIHSIYFGDKNRKIDMNYVMTHQARESLSRMEARGVLLDQSQKVFRGTLDFIKGSNGSKGKEEEYTVLLSPTVRNRSIPLMLCGEDAVEGQHAVSTGKIDENKLFYLMSRGLSEVEAKKIIIEASFQPILEKIPVTELKDTISTYLRRRLSHVQ
jgi:FeS assembly protein SufD